MADLRADAHYPQGRRTKQRGYVGQRGPVLRPGDPHQPTPRSCPGGAGMVTVMSSPPRAAVSRPGQAARRRTSQTVAAMSSTDSASSQPPSIHWNGQNRLPGW